MGVGERSLVSLQMEGSSGIFREFWVSVRW